MVFIYHLVSVDFPIIVPILLLLLFMRQILGDSLVKVNIFSVA